MRELTNAYMMGKEERRKLNIFVVIILALLFCKKIFLKILPYSQESNCVGVSPLFNKVAGLYCEQFKNTCFVEHMRTATSKKVNFKDTLNLLCNFELLQRFYSLDLKHYLLLSKY